MAPAADSASARDETAPAGKAGGGSATIVRTATVDLEVGKGGLNDTVNRATDVVTRAKGIYVGSSTSLPDGDPASGQVTFRVPVDAFEPVLRELKALGTYRGEQSSTEDVTTQYIDLNGQLAAWRAQERVYLRLLDRAKSVTDVIAVQNQLQQVQSNIERLQGQLDHLEDQSSFSTIVLRLTEPGAAAGEPTGRLARAWATAVDGLGVMAAAVLVGVVWLTPLRTGTTTAGHRSAQARVSASQPQAEGVADGVEVDPYVLLGLVVGEDGAQGDGVGPGGLQVVHLDVQVDLHLLVPGTGRPGRPDVGLLELERQPTDTVGGAERHPVRLVGADRPAQQPAVEPGQRPRVGCVEHRRRQLQRWPLGHIASRVGPSRPFSPKRATDEVRPSSPRPTRAWCCRS